VIFSSDGHETVTFSKKGFRKENNIYSIIALKDLGETFPFADKIGAISCYVYNQSCLIFFDKEGSDAGIFIKAPNGKSYVQINRVGLIDSGRMKIAMSSEMPGFYVEQGKEYKFHRVGNRNYIEQLYNGKYAKFTSSVGQEGIVIGMKEMEHGSYGKVQKVGLSFNTRRLREIDKKDMIREEKFTVYSTMTVAYAEAEKVPRDRIIRMIQSRR
jgi:hypothetical protein